MSSFRNLIAFVLAMIATNIKATFAQRGAFWMQAAFMMLNNLIFCVVWFIFFGRFEEIRGWRLQEVLGLYAVVAMAFGSSVAITGGFRELSRMIVDGDLDTFLTQPKHPLVQAVCSRSFAMGWGDILSGFILLWMSGYATWANAPIVLVCALCGWAIMVSTAIVAHSMAFWLGPITEIARQFTMFLITFSVYPQSIYGGWVKVLLFTLIPAGFMGYLPVQLLLEFRWDILAALIAGTAAYVGIAFAVFAVGLKRYESGTQMGLRT